MFQQSLIFFLEKEFFHIYDSLWHIYGLIAIMFVYSVFHSVDKKII